ncbi:MAG: hypothetical protein L6Q69_20395 [Zoogloea sp.]|nr:hypothetical protein [Zoogloea sp.]
MTSPSVADMLGVWLAPSCEAGTTPAKVANSANHAHSCGFVADTHPCEGLRGSAMAARGLANAAGDSQTFAVVRNRCDAPQSEPPRGVSHDSQDSQGVLSGKQELAVARLGDRTAARLARLKRWGWPADEARALAERLRLRDVHADHRHLCVECPHLSGSVARGWRCGNHRAAQVGHELPRELVGMFQDCPGFAIPGARLQMGS